MTLTLWGLLLGAATLIVYHFVAYPLVVTLLAGRRARPDRPAAEPDSWPSISLLIAAYNEERVIEAKIANSLALEYPGPLQIIVVSDGSDDGTHAIARRWSEAGVLALHAPARRGKSAALNRGAEHATGEVLVLSDANNDFSPGALRALAAHFADPAVGAACGRKTIRPDPERESSEGDGLYWRYESALKAAESALGIMTTADGEMLALRRALFEPIDPEVINDDAEITFAVLRRGLRIVYEPGAVSTELASRRLEEDYRVKVRMIAGGFQTLQRHWRRLLPPRTAFAWAFLSHKLLRWLTPLLLAVVLACSLALSRHPAAAALLALQVAFYGAALLGWFGRHRRRLPAWQYVPLYFGVMNIAALAGLRRFLAGEDVTAIWHRAAR